MASGLDFRYAFSGLLSLQLAWRLIWGFHFFLLFRLVQLDPGIFTGLWMGQPTRLLIHHTMRIFDPLHKAPDISMLLFNVKPSVLMLTPKREPLQTRVLVHRFPVGEGGGVRLNNPRRTGDV